MGFMVSPGVSVVERDLSTYIPATATSVAAYVGSAQLGPVWQRVLVTNERDLVDTFGIPLDSTYEDFFTAASFLGYGNSLYFTRVVDKVTATNAKLSCNTGTTPPVSGTGDYVEFYNPEKILSASGTGFTPTFGSYGALLYAKYPGSHYNAEIQYTLINQTDYNAAIAGSTAFTPYIKYITDPITASDEYILMISTEDTESKSNTPSGTYSIAEVFKVSTTSTKKDSFGNNMFIENVINTTSKYAMAFYNTAAVTTLASFIAQGPGGGADGTAASAAQITQGYDLYRNPEDVDINIIIGGRNTTASIALNIDDICQSRKDCIGVLNVQKSDVVLVSSVATALTNCTTYRKTTLNINSSYSALYANWFKINDKYNDKKRWIPSSGAVAGIFAYTDYITDPWFAPAGLNRGILRNVLELAINPDQGTRDSLYQNQLNPIVNFPGQGITIWGQKTLQTKPSAFDRVNVRRLFLVLEKGIATAAKYFVFEPNDPFSQSMFKNMVEPFLKDVKGRRGLYDFAVDVSANVNTPERIDRNEFWAEIYISPTKAAEFLTLRFNATRTGVNFAELTGGK